MALKNVRELNIIFVHSLVGRTQYWLLPLHPCNPKQRKHHIESLPSATHVYEVGEVGEQRKEGLQSLTAYDKGDPLLLYRMS